ncbi:hypothetical protein Q8A67_016796 [Cirrhinus molitorella]|uniref:non-specific serine/threonine protein kinase n=1 Tax=Cirrhinus molitorella TaxID=172907 RepID=A0AA88PHC5_9TELE|nr:hypothetical protein Q8A67_016796 [Cirrhinus molitorella]
MPFQPETGPADPLSTLESTPLWDPADPLPGRSGLEPPAHRGSDLTDPNPVPGESDLKPTLDTDPACPEPAEMGNKISAGMFGSVFQGTWKSDSQQPGYSKPLLLEVALNLLLKKALSSPNIVYMLEWSEEEDQHILILEYPQPCPTLLGIRLDRKCRTLNETQARGLMFQAVISLIRDPDKRVMLEQLLDHKWFQQEDDPAVAQESGGVT